MDVWWNNHFLWKDLVHPIETGCLRFQEFMSHNCSRISSEQRHQNRKTPWAGDSLWDEPTRAPGESFRGLSWWNHFFLTPKNWDMPFLGHKNETENSAWNQAKMRLFGDLEGMSLVWVMNLFPFLQLLRRHAWWVFSQKNRGYFGKSRLFWYKMAHVNWYLSGFLHKFCEVDHLGFPPSYFPNAEAHRHLQIFSTMMPSRLATVKIVKVAMIWLWDGLESIQKPSFMGFNLLVVMLIWAQSIQHGP